MELSLISFPPSPSLICASSYLDGDGGARRGGDSSPLTNCKVWESLEVQLFQRKTPSDQHGSIADRVAALRSASFTPPSTRSVRAPHRGPARRHPHPHSITTPLLCDTELPQTLTNICRNVSQLFGKRWFSALRLSVLSLINSVWWRINFPPQQV